MIGLRITIYSWKFICRIHDLQLAGIDYRSLNFLFKDFLRPDDDTDMSIPREEFEVDSNYWLRTISPTIYQRLLDVMTRNGVIKLKVLALILDAYKYMPIKVVKSKNDSAQFRRQLMVREMPERETQLQRNFVLLGDRVEDKFKQMTKAYRFFDANKVRLKLLKPFYLNWITEGWICVLCWI